MAVGVLQVSDVHLGSSERPEGSADPDDRLDAVLAAAAERLPAPDLVVASGDLTDDASAAACARLAGRLRALGAPVVAVPGNHDDPTTVAAAFGPPVAEVGAWRVVGIDTSRPQQVHGTADPEALADLLDGLDARPTLVVVHHPPTAPSTNPWFRLEHGAGLVAVLARRPHVKAVLSGHLHVPFEAEVDGVPVLGAPSTWIGIHHDGDEFVVGGDERTGARWLVLHDDGSFESTLLQA